MSHPVTDTLITIIETNAFIAQAKNVFADHERQEIINMIAADPMCGAIMRGTGGIRKVRVSLPGRGKSGGVRVVYFYRNKNMPVFLFAVFAKNEKDNMTKSERNALKKTVKILVREWSGK